MKITKDTITESCLKDEHVCTGDQVTQKYGTLKCECDCHKGKP